ncbi:hypothetical protein HMPREF9630_00097 [Peptoanaerobacter stomatis]|uniref:Threonine/Serine exporter ThrE domain-containing protein n=1 Tax=Peptoanaerobacter stomatis TaxID=796937 RepID=V9HLH2_9FIRM|nr:threonine/serine exporter family protein [Peptoanaerobacter stomatis]EHL18372.1 hypothetical protein HMPREF9630_00097 [Peptoanaerobacter stomatis]
MSYVVLQLIAAFIGTSAFSVLFSVPKKYYLHCGFVGSIGWAVYLAVNLNFHRPIIATFMTSLVLTVVSRYLSVQYKATTTMFLLCGIFTIVPGAWIYYTAYYGIIGNETEAIRKGFESIKLALSIGMGIGVAYSISPKVFGWKKSADVWREDKE